MPKKYKISTLILILNILLISCEEPFNYDNFSDPKLVVIQGWLTNEYKKQEIILSWTKANPGDSTIYISHAYVVVNDGTNLYTFKDTTKLLGHYYSSKPFAASVGKTYYLTVKVNDKIYLSNTTVLPVSFPDNIQLAFDSAQNKYYIKQVAPIFSPYESAIYIICLDWSQVNNYQNLPYDSTHAKLYFFTLQTMDVNEIFHPYQRTTYFPPGTLIHEYKYSVTPFFASYIRALLSESQWSGSLFDVQHWNLPTNISNGALGYFTASSVVIRKYIAGE